MAQLFCISLHGYIIFYLGFVGALPQGRRRLFIVGWNAMCCALTQIALASHVPDIFGCWPVSLIMFCAMVLLPGAMLLGDSGDACLAHAYFAPGWFGNPALLVPAVAVAKLSSSIKASVKFYPPGKLLAIDNIREHVDVLEMEMDAVGTEWLVMDSSWVDSTHRLALGDPEWNNHYATGMHGFWQEMVDVVLQVPCVLVLRRHWSWQLGEHDAVHVIQPSK